MQNETPQERDPQQFERNLKSAFPAVMTVKSMARSIVIQASRRVIYSRSREHCASCGEKIPPGKAGRECQSCRQQ